MVRERITSQSPILKERRRRSLVKFLWILVGAVVVLIGLSFLSRLDSLLIHSVSFSGNQVLKSEDLEKAALGDLKENRIFLFAGENKLLFSKKRLIHDLKKQFPRILDIGVTRSGDSLSLTITERERAFLWCGSEAPLGPQDETSVQQCYFVDMSGFIFDVSPQFSSGVYFMLYAPIEEGDPVGQHIFNFEFLKDVDSFARSVEERGFPVHSLVLKEGGQYELLFNMSTIRSAYPRLLFTSDQGLGEVYDKFVSVVTQEPFKTDFIEKQNRLEYIDARFHNRVFYKFTDS